MTLYFLEGKVRMERGSDEAELVWKAKMGNLSAFDELVRRYRSAAMITAKGILANRELADDAVQEAFLSAYKALPQLQDVARFGHWIFSIVRHRALRLRSGERLPHLPIDDLIASHVPSIQGVMEQESERAEIRCAINDLSKDLQEVVQLYYLSDWSVGAIADYLSIPYSTVKWRLHVARQQLRALLSHQIEESK